VPESVTINGFSFPNYNPNTGFSVGTIASENKVTVTYQAKVLKVPTPGLNAVYNTSSLTYDYLPNPLGVHITNTVISNRVQTIIDRVDYSITKAVDKDYAQVGDSLIYTSVIKNLGSVPLTKVIFYDTTSSYLNFIPENVYIGEVNYPNYNPNIGFPLPDIHPGDTITITFGAVINGAPPYTTILNTSQVNSSYQLNPTSPIVYESKTSNEVATNVVLANLNITKSVDKAYATVNDILTYNFNISNIGTTTTLNNLFRDIVPTASTFMPGTVTINGIIKETLDPSTGFNIGTLNVGQVTSISFDVKIISAPTPNTITNNGSISFDYYVNPVLGLKAG